MTATNINAPDIYAGWDAHAERKANRIEWGKGCQRERIDRVREKCLQIKGFKRTGFHAEYIDL